MRKGIITAITASIIATAINGTAFAGQWIQDGTRQSNEHGVSNWRYLNDDGSYLTDDWDWLDRDGDGYAELYYFDISIWKRMRILCFNQRSGGE